MDVLSETLTKLCDLAVQAAGSNADLPERRSESLFMVGGEVRREEKDPPARMHTAHDLHTLLHYAQPDQSVVWLNPEAAWLVIDDTPGSLRDDLVVWPLEATSAWVAITKAGAPRDQPSFVQFLRQNLRDEIEAAHPGLLNTLRNLRFTSNDDARGEIAGQNETFGREIQRRVTGADVLPTDRELLIKVQRWATHPSIVVEVECQLGVDLEKRTLSLTPRPDSITRANLAAVSALAEQIRDGEIPVLLGCLRR